MAPRLLDLHGQPISADAIARVRILAAAGAYVAAGANAQELRDWSPLAGSPDADLDGDRTQLLARARDLDRNDPLVAGAVQSLKDTAIGFDLAFQAMPDYRGLGLTRDAVRDAANRIEDLWREWAEDRDCCDVTGQASFGQMTRQAVHSDLTNGESLALALWLPERQARLGSRFATVLQAIEPDRLGNPHLRPSDMRMRDGIEIDEFGAPVAYHVEQTHPGDQILLFAGPRRWERVPVRGPMGRRGVIQSFDQKRPGQHRGVSWLSPVMLQIKQLNRMTRAELQAAVLNAIIAMVLESPLDGSSLLDLFGSAEKFQSQRGQAAPLQLGIGPGGVIPRLPPGEKLTGFASNRPNNAFDGFVVSVERMIAAGLGMTYETFTRDYSKTNYSSARASMLEGWRFILFLRMHKALTWCRPVLELVIEEAVWRGYIDLPGFETSRAARRAWLRGLWRGPARGWVDPVKEIQAAAMRVRLGISTLRDEAMEQGRDLDDLLDQIELEQEALKKRGLTLPDVDFTPAREVAIAAE